MTIASCGSVSATTLGLPNSTAIPAEKARLPKGLFVAKIPVSAKTKQRLANDIESITMLSLLQARNIGLAAGTRVPEILVIGLRLHEPNAAVPTDIVELIAMQRKSGMPARAGHTTTSKVFASDWQPAGEATLNATDPAVDSMYALWESLCSQVILDDPSPIDVNTRLARRMQIAHLTAQVDKLTRDHQRAKNPEQRNEIFAKLHKMKKQLEELQQTED